MKIYVDELPKSCNDCEFGYFYDCQYCTLRPDLMKKDEWCEKEKHCSLLSTQSLKQQVREEVVERMSEDYDVDNRYILENKSFVDTKTNEYLNFGLKDLSRVAVQLNCMERYLNDADQQIAKLQKQLKQLQKQLAIEELEKIKNYFDDSDDDKYNESEGWIISNRNVVEYVNNQIKQLKEMK